MPKNRLQAIPLGIFNSAALTANYKPIYAGGLPAPLALLRIVNLGTEDIIISYDGITDHDYITANTTFTLPAQLSAQPNNWVMLIAKGYALSVKQAKVPGVGNIYVSGYYTAE
jgi:hypothetical protein